MPTVLTVADRLRVLCVSVLVVTTALFVIGSTVEKDSHDEPTEHATTEAHGEAGETEEAHADEAVSEPAHGDADAGGEAKVLGVDREAAGVVAIVAVASLALAGLVWSRPRRAVWLAVALVGAVFTVVDVGEVAHQLDDSRDGLAVLAAAVTAGHLVVAVTGVLGARRARAAEVE